MNKLKLNLNLNQNKKATMMIYSFIVAFICLLICSKNSFLYTLNDWYDANAFFTVGKGMFKGITPYKDIFEQKGLFLYLIYGLGSLISYTSFHGVFIFEVAFFTVFLYYCHKIIEMFVEQKYSFILLPLMGSFIVTRNAFVQGGSAEEFCLPFIAITLYYFIRHFKQKELTRKEFIITGFLAGLVLMIKFTMLGLWIGFMIYILYTYLREKRFKDIVKSSLYFLGAMAVPFIVGLIYMAINNGVKEFFYVYFYVNMTAYPVQSKARILDLMKIILDKLYYNGVMGRTLIAILPYCIYKLDISKKAKIGIGVLATSLLFFIYIGIRSYKYYMLPLFAFAIFSMISITKIICSKFKISTKVFTTLGIISFILMPIICYLNANYKEDIGRSREEYIQYKYADIINKEENATLLNMESLDVGLYTTSGVLPSTYYFEKQNIPGKKFPDIAIKFKEYIENKKTKFVILSTKHDLNYLKKKSQYIFNNYEVIEAETQEIENEKINMFLLKKRE